MMKYHKASGKAVGFTLIELLIVVAIIAILAAIAVPNFLEAQVRSKVARVHADMRSVATAIESYAADFNMAPPGWREHSDLTPWGDVLGCYIHDRFAANKAALARLTTPIAYMTTIPSDPFQTKALKKAGAFDTTEMGPFPFNYDTYAPFGDDYAGGNFVQVKNMGYTWCLNSPGPALKDGNSARIILNNSALNKDIGHFVYDSSNGTVSTGLLMRTNKGVFEGPEQ